jgi:uncharacterized membrane protein YjjP (DUF1212 family)
MHREMSVPPDPIVPESAVVLDFDATFPPRSLELDFLLRSAEFLHAYGTPAHRLEETLSACARRLGVRSQFFSTPTSFLAAFGASSAQRTNLLRIEPGEIDLEKLVLFDRVLTDFLAGRTSAEEGLLRLEAIASAPARFAKSLVVLAYGIASGGAAVFFGGGANELLLSFLLGLGCGLLALVSSRRARARRVFEPTSAFLAAFLSVVATHFWPPVSNRIVTLAALIVLLPGLSLTVAMIELATRHLVSGTARLMGALTVFLTIAFGVAFGRRVGELVLGAAPPEGVIDALPAWASMPALLASSFAFLVLFRARPIDFGWILVTGFLEFEGARLGARELGPELGAFGGALILGVLSNLFARFLHRPASVTLVPGILLLVPGSIGFQSLSFFIAHDTLSGMEAAFRTTLVAITLVGGLLFANVLVSPRRTL